MQEMNPQNISHGFIIIPKALLLDQFADCDSHEGEIEAFLKLLMKVNYSETTTTDYWRNTSVCQRGESLNSYRSWSSILHWTVGRTYRFLKRLEAKGIIEIIPHDDDVALHIRVVDYESWTSLPTAPATPEKQQQKKKADDEKFRIFWDAYHNTMQLPKENIARAQRIWKKLSEKERQLAIDNIEEYYYHLSNTKYTLHACSYLANKAFLNEY